MSYSQSRYSNRSWAAQLFAASIALAGVVQAAVAQECKPILSVKNVEFSPMRLPTLERRWTATVLVDASHCSTTVGYFEIGFSRLKENGDDMDFRERFAWSSPSITIGVDFWADEAVQHYWIDSVQACPCPQ
jgi:hypothetical protein